MVNGIYKKLSEIQGQLSIIGKSGKHFQNYKYATEADFLEALHPLCAEKGICISTSAIEERTELGRFESVNGKGVAGITRFAVVCVQTTVTDSEDGSSIVVVMPGYAEDAGDKAIYKALTGATKYAVWKAFNLATGDDPENESKPKQSAAQPAKPPATPAPVQQIETMDVTQLFEEFKIRCGTNGFKPSEQFKKLMGAELQEGVKFIDLPIEKAKALVLSVEPF